jgi:hypothetical protein
MSVGTYHDSEFFPPIRMHFHVKFKFFWEWCATVNMIIVLLGFKTRRLINQWTMSKIIGMFNILDLYSEGICFEYRLGYKSSWIFSGGFRSVQVSTVVLSFIMWENYDFMVVTDWNVVFWVLIPCNLADEYCFLKISCLQILFWIWRQHASPKLW